MRYLRPNLVQLNVAVAPVVNVVVQPAGAGDLN